MPPRVMDANQAGVGFGAWYGAIPPITRVHLTAVFATTAAVSLGALSPRSLVLYWPWVVKNLEVRSAALLSVRPSAA